MSYARPVGNRLVHAGFNELRGLDGQTKVSARVLKQRDGPASEIILFTNLEAGNRPESENANRSTRSRSAAPPNATCVMPALGRSRV